MGSEQRRNLHKLEGRTVHISLIDGSRLDEVALVSARRSTLWVFANGEDTFLPIDQVIDVWEAQPFRSAA
jgi:hypothetical protein